MREYTAVIFIFAAVKNLKFHPTESGLSLRLKYNASGSYNSVNKKITLISVYCWDMCCFLCGVIQIHYCHYDERGEDS